MKTFTKTFGYRQAMLAVSVLTIFMGIAVRLVFLQVIDRDILRPFPTPVPIGLIPSEVQKFIDLFYTAKFSLFVFACGASLFWFRKRFRFYYGTLEVATGLITAVSFRSNAPIDLLLAMRVLGGVYIIVRGLDNITTSFAATREKQPNNTLIPSSTFDQPAAGIHEATATGGTDFQR